MSDLLFKEGNPGSVQFGNFINYYKFHPPEQRINLLPINLWDTHKGTRQILLDVGCNAGDLTKSLHDLFYNSISNDTSIIGIDIDPTLIKRAQEEHGSNQLVFECGDIMNDADTTIDNYLKLQGVDKFSTTFCFSVTMWIHLNYGDEGLKSFLTKMTQLSNILVLEPQPWKCYKSAVKRLKLSKKEFPFFQELRIRENVEAIIEMFLVNKCKAVKIGESDRNDWERKLLFFKC